MAGDESRICIPNFLKHRTDLQMINPYVKHVSDLHAFFSFIYNRMCVCVCVCVWTVNYGEFLYM